MKKLSLEEKKELLKSKLEERLKTQSVARCSSDLNVWLTSIFGKYLEQDPASLSKDEPVSALGLNSVLVAQIIGDLEELLGKPVPESLFFQEYSINDLSNILSEYREGKRDIDALDRDFEKKLFSQLIQIPQVNCLVSNQTERKVIIDEKNVSDFASLNYLSLDLHPQVRNSILPMVEKWGTHPSWTRAVASPLPYLDLEIKLAEFLKAPHTLLFPTITMMNLGVLPILAKNGVVLADVAAHETTHEACELVRARGGTYDKFKYNDVDSLKEKLEIYKDRENIVIAVDGVYSMTAEYAKLPEYAELARKYNAILYVDDAHGFGVIGESPDENMPYGYKGNGIVNYYGLDYKESRIIYVASLSKAFSSLGALITCFDDDMKLKLTMASTYIFSGPIPMASLATALEGLKVNEKEGDQARTKIYQLTRKLVDGARDLGFTVDNESYFPFMFVVIGSMRDTIDACNILWENDILISPGVFPAVPVNRCGLRISVTSAHTEEQIHQTLNALKIIKKGER